MILSHYKIKHRFGKLRWLFGTGIGASVVAFGMDIAGPLLAGSSPDNPAFKIIIWAVGALFVMIGSVIIGWQLYRLIKLLPFKGGIQAPTVRNRWYRRWWQSLKHQTLPHALRPKTHKRVYVMFRDSEQYTDYAQPFNEFVNLMNGRALPEVAQWQSEYQVLLTQIEQYGDDHQFNNQDLRQRSAQYKWPTLIWHNHYRALAVTLPDLNLYQHTMTRMYQALDTVADGGLWEFDYLNQIRYEQITLKGAAELRRMINQYARSHDGELNIEEMPENQTEQFGVANDHRDHYWCYVLLLANGRFYVGITNNPSRRMKEHQSGSGSKVTHNGQVVGMAALKDLGTMTYGAAERLEDEETLRLMTRYGVTNVRGGHWAIDETKNTIFRLLRQRGDILATHNISPYDMLWGD
ncbi:GIY-YIG nuclease family protein [Agrilactobacillus yilanensis]|uniref:GIY-YIG nuclease family protein n=1 Tax=Agrilactobacillus yilanensis TaxID=2485997 RepID=A0ABW4J901_9LACO|nr:GIY-YIG nuclease family protein [Agrilactobacillus yilanensis]